MERNYLHERKRGLQPAAGGIITPEGIAFWVIVCLALTGDYILGVLRFILGYAGFLTGYMTTPITPYTDIMSALTFSLVFTTLYRRGSGTINALVVGISTVAAALSSFEFIWDLLQVMKYHLNTWLGYPGPLWHYAFAFISITVLCFTGAGYWKFRWWSATLLALYPLSFIAWYLAGYPQPWGSGTPDSAYIWNVTTKIMSFLAFLAPVAAYRSVSPETERRA